MTNPFTISHYALSLFAKLPLPIIHWLGTLLGWLVYFVSSKYAGLIRRNIGLSGFAPNKQTFQTLLHQNIAESGKGLLETFAIWLRNDQSVLKLIKGCEGWVHVEAALSQKRGIIFLTPHLGCFEITSIYYGQFQPITVLFRPPRQSWLMPLINTGRQRGRVSLAPANSHGVKQLLQALKRGEAIGILPDQAPLAGEGEWVPFFGRDAYTMTLASKLAEKTGAQVFMAFGERLRHGAGYTVHIKPIENGGINTPRLLNQQLEQAIGQCPSQYLWMYERYKARK